MTDQWKQLDKLRIWPEKRDCPIFCTKCLLKHEEGHNDGWMIKKVQDKGITSQWNTLCSVWDVPPAFAPPLQKYTYTCKYCVQGICAKCKEEGHDKTQCKAEVMEQ